MHSIFLYKAMNYTPGDIFKAMGRKWCDNDFNYPLDQNLCYSTESITTIQRKWVWRAQCIFSCKERCEIYELLIPNQRAQIMPHKTPQLLEATLFRALEEENWMRLHLLSHSLLEYAKTYAEEGYTQHARQYPNIISNSEYKSDSFMSNDE